MDHYDVAPLEGYHPEVGLLLSCLRDSTREWRENLEDPPVEAIVWQPTEGAYSIGGLLLHLIDCEDSWFHSFLAGNPRDPEEVAQFQSSDTNQYEGVWASPPAQPLSWYYELHDRIRTRAFEAVKGIRPQRVYQRPSRGYDCTMRWVVSHVLEHDAYTGGQAVALHELWRKMQTGTS